MSDTGYIVGIDEAGRGPLAGPVAVGAIVVPAEFVTDDFSDITDSKLLSEKERESSYQHLSELKEEGKIDWRVTYAMHTTIDKKGIVGAIQTAINRTLRKFEYINEENSKVVLDGSLSAPRTYPNQETIIKGDISNPIIGAASIVAKVERDRTMVRYEQDFPAFSFGQHKGYPTQGHYEEIDNHGPTRIHRKSFL